MTLDLATVDNWYNEMGDFCEVEINKAKANPLKVALLSNCLKHVKAAHMLHWYAKKAQGQT